MGLTGPAPHGYGGRRGGGAMARVGGRVDRRTGHDGDVSTRSYRHRRRVRRYRWRAVLRGEAVRRSRYRRRRGFRAAGDRTRPRPGPALELPPVAVYSPDFSALRREASSGALIVVTGGERPGSDRGSPCSTPSRSPRRSAHRPSNCRVPTGNVCWRRHSEGPGPRS